MSAVRWDWTLTSDNTFPWTEEEKEAPPTDDVVRWALYDNDNDECRPLSIECDLEQTKFYVFNDPDGTAIVCKETLLSGPFPTLEAAKVAYLVREAVE